MLFTNKYRTNEILYPTQANGFGFSQMKIKADDIEKSRFFVSVLPSFFSLFKTLEFVEFLMVFM